MKKVEKGKMYLGWEGGISDILIDLKKKKLYHYETDYDSVHSEYGGKNYYQSRTGLTGAGYIEYFDSLILGGWYDTKSNNSISKEESYPLYEINNISIRNIKISIFVPLSHHKKEWTENLYAPHFPFVLKIAAIDFYYAHKYYLFFTHWFSEIFSILETLSIKGETALEGFQKKEINIKFFSGTTPFTLTINVINHEYGIGLDYTKFFLKEIKDQMYQPSFEHISYLHDLFNVVRTDYYFYKIKYYDSESKGISILTDIIDEDPLFADNKIIEKWTGMKVTKRDKKHGIERILLQKVYNDYVLLIAYANLTSIFKGYEFISQENAFAEYEYRVPRIAYMLNEETYNSNVLHYLNRRILDLIKRAKKVKEKLFEDEQLLSFIKENPEIEITFEDSIAAGNCPVGTERFAKEHFNSARKIKLIELEKFIGNPYVNRVIRYIKEQKVVS
ncbi:hypothetical protein [Caldanaerobacter subterraneus]|uniref:Uncharacterized protein n=1 Tax=Caldanaerobacter subterraneus TaxID=911092 RepID=A0A7Y2L603_9THEO|nr:hypothetical protein [Caldanaerobacter subterraneus]NNG66402.1 hypothetical protein [Caldanaerobacter subterraneus]